MASISVVLVDADNKEPDEENIIELQNLIRSKNNPVSIVPENDSLGMAYASRISGQYRIIKQREALGIANRMAESKQDCIFFMSSGEEFDGHLSQQRLLNSGVSIHVFENKTNLEKLKYMKAKAKEALTSSKQLYHYYKHYELQSKVYTPKIEALKVSIGRITEAHEKLNSQIAELKEKADCYIIKDWDREAKLNIVKFTYEKDEDSWMLKIRNNTPYNFINVYVFMIESKAAVTSFQLIEPNSKVFRKVTLAYHESLYTNHLVIQSEGALASDPFPISPIEFTKVRAMKNHKVKVSIINKSQSEFKELALASPGLDYTTPIQQTLTYDNTSTASIKFDKSATSAQLYVLHRKNIVSNSFVLTLPPYEEDDEDSSSSEDMKVNDPEDRKFDQQFPGVNPFMTKGQVQHAKSSSFFNSESSIKSKSKEHDNIPNIAGTSQLSSLAKADMQKKDTQALFEASKAQPRASEGQTRQSVPTPVQLPNQPLVKNPNQPLILPPNILPNQTPIQPPVVPPNILPNQTPIQPPVVPPNIFSGQSPIQPPPKNPFQTTVVPPNILPNQTPIQTTVVPPNILSNQPPIQPPAQNPIQTTVVPPNILPSQPTPGQPPIQPPNFFPNLSPPGQLPNQPPVQNPIVQTPSVQLPDLSKVPGSDSSLPKNQFKPMGINPLTKK